MRFDWYQATIPVHPVVLVETIKNFLAPGGDVQEGRGKHNYHQSFTVRDQRGERVALVLAGGPNGHPNAAASGASTEAFVSLVREQWPEHHVTRFDAAEDFCEAGAWDRLETVCRGVAKDHGVKARLILPDDLSEGRTYYMGAPTSDVRVRLYEKTAEVRRGLPPDRWSEVPENWVRLETQVRPRKDFKKIAAMVEPQIAWGFSGWTSQLAAKALHIELERIKMQAGRETDDERAFRFMLRQYGRVFLNMRRDLGNWECVGLTIGEGLKKLGK